MTRACVARESEIAAALLAGSTVTGADKVVYSNNDGDSWSDADKEPSGLGLAWVVTSSASERRRDKN